MGISPIYAIRRILKEVGLEKEEVDVYEVRPSDLTRRSGYTLCLPD